MMRKIHIFTVLLITTFTLQSGAVPFEGSKILMTSPNPFAVEAGEEIARKGGNVVDVAVAIGLTLAVTNPYNASFGGGGFALIKMGKKDVDVIDFRETAPKNTGPKYYMDKSKDASKFGGTAVGVPGVPAGLWEMHQKYGKLKWSQLFTYPIRIASRGFRVSGEWARNTERAAQRFNKGAKNVFLKKGKTPYKPGELMKQPKLAKVLKEMRNRNIVPFYRENVARDIVNSVKKAGGHMTIEDMKSYKPRWLKPLKTNFKGFEVNLMPPPSSGGVVIKAALKLLEKLKVDEKPTLSTEEFHLLAEVQKIVFRGRALLGDPSFHKNPIEKLTSDQYLYELGEKIKADGTLALTPLTEENPPAESSETTHYNVMDVNGNAVSLTVTLNGNYGAHVASDKYGISLNNEMDDFTTRPGEPNLYGLIQGQGNLVQPGKRPLSSMSPTIVTKKGKAVMSVGAPGGPRIINGVLLTLYRVLANGYDVDWAIQAPRVHHQFLPDTLYVDTKRHSPDVLNLLREKGHKIEESWHSKVQAIRINDKKWLEASFDSRGEGAAGGF